MESDGQAGETTGADEKAAERAALVELLTDARAVVLQLETALGRLDSGTAVEHPVVFWRKRRRISQGNLARAVGITPAGISRIEHQPGFKGRPETRARIAAVLGVPEEWLYLSSDEPEAPPEA